MLLYIYKHIYIYIYRERERERCTHISPCAAPCHHAGFGGCPWSQLPVWACGVGRSTARLLLHFGSRGSANNEFSMHAATALGVARRSQSKRHGAGNYPARAGASSSAGGNPARASTA